MDIHPFFIICIAIIIALLVGILVYITQSPSLARAVDLSSPSGRTAEDDPDYDGIRYGTVGRIMFAKTLSDYNGTVLAFSDQADYLYRTIRGDTDLPLTSRMILVDKRLVPTGFDFHQHVSGIIGFSPMIGINLHTIVLHAVCANGAYELQVWTKCDSVFSYTLTFRVAVLEVLPAIGMGRLYDIHLEPQGSLIMIVETVSGERDIMTCDIDIEVGCIVGIRRVDHTVIQGLTFRRLIYFDQRPLLLMTETMEDMEHIRIVVAELVSQNDTYILGHSHILRFWDVRNESDIRMLDILIWLGPFLLRSKFDDIVRSYYQQTHIGNVFASRNIYI